MSHLISFNPTSNNEPIIVRKSKVTNWPCYQWTSNEWLHNLNDLQLTFRLHSKSSCEIAWENGAIARINSTLDQFSSWTNNNNLQAGNPFAEFDCKQFWAYSSYNHLAKLPYELCKTLINSINWSSIDFGTNLGNDGMTSTFWLGTAGAVTSCHYDTYGLNIVTQIRGKKLWILFPPSDTDNLYPTRIPFEESSVFSEVNIELPDFNAFPNFSKTHPFSVILEPGDVLVVPHHWWHYVKCIDDGPDGLCISINQWLPMEKYFDSLCEGVTSLLVSSLFPFYQPKNENWLNDENDEDALNDPSMIINLITELAEKQSNFGIKVDRWIDYIPEKYETIQEIDFDQLAKYFHSDVDNDLNLKAKVNSINNFDLKRSAQPGNSIKNIIKCFLKPNVIQLIAKNILDEFKHDKL